MKHAVQVEVLRELMQQLDDGVNADAGGLRAVPADTYTSPEVAALEWAAFFRGHAQLVGLSGDLPEPGSFLTTNDVGVPMLVTRDAGGQVRAFLNACRHRGSMLETARRGRQPRFSCPFHAWTYDNAGKLIGVPQEAQFGAIDKACLGLIELPAVEHLGMIVVHPDPAGVIDTDVLFDGIADDLASWNWGAMAFTGEQRLELRLNWKLATDTFGETYHFKRLHKDTLAQSFHGDVLSYRAYDRNNRMVLCKRPIDALRGTPEADWDVRTGGFPVYFLFPNTVINVAETWIAVVRVYPDPNDPARSVAHIGYYFDAAALAASPELAEMAMAGFTNVVVHEDFATAARTQTALDAGLLDTLIIGRNEPPLHHYHNTFRRVLGLEPLPFMTAGAALAAE